MNRQKGENREIRGKRDRKKKLLLAFVLAVFLLAVSACLAEKPSVIIKGHEFKVKAAGEGFSGHRGLMLQFGLPKDEGMLFVLEKQALQSFWMKNMLFPIDMIFIDENMTVADINRNAQPCSGERCPSYPSSAPAKYVLEVNAGTCDSLNIRVGDAVLLRNV